MRYSRCASGFTWYLHDSFPYLNCLLYFFLLPQESAVQLHHCSAPVLKRRNGSNTRDGVRIISELIGPSRHPGVSKLITNVFPPTKTVSANRIVCFHCHVTGGSCARDLNLVHWFLSKKSLIGVVMEMNLSRNTTMCSRMLLETARMLSCSWYLQRTANERTTKLVRSRRNLTGQKMELVTWHWTVWTQERKEHR